MVGMLPALSTEPRARVRPVAGRLAAMVLMALALLAVPVTASAAPATAPPPATTPSGSTGSTVGDNPYIPEDANIGDCISALPRPECGSHEQGGSRQYLILAVLLAGMGFVGWRVARGVRARDRATAPPASSSSTHAG
jgi:hypothetical protein